MIDEIRVRIGNNHVSGECYVDSIKLEVVPVLFREDFDGVNGADLTTLGWTHMLGSSILIDNTVIDSGNAAHRSGGGASSDFYEKALPGGAYTLSENEHFAYEVVMKVPVVGFNPSGWLVLGQSGGGDYKGTLVSLYPSEIDLGSDGIAGGTVSYSTAAASVNTTYHLRGTLSATETTLEYSSNGGSTWTPLTIAGGDQGGQSMIDEIRIRSGNCHAGGGEVLWDSIKLEVKCVPAWVAELSDHTAQDARGLSQAKAESIEIWMPAGTYATVGVYDTGTVDVQAPETVRTDTYRIRHVDRTTFKLGQGFGITRQIDYTAIPYTKADPPPGKEWSGPIPWYLSPPHLHDGGPPGANSSWAIRMFCDKPGVQKMLIKCDRNVITVALHVTEPVPAADCAFGFYHHYIRCPYPETLKLQYEQLREYGCNTVSVFGQAMFFDESEEKTMQAMADQIDLGVETGLFDKRKGIPVMVQQGLDRLRGAVKRGRHVSEWPELIYYGRDESPRRFVDSQASETKSAHNAGFRTGFAIPPDTAFFFGDLVDIWLVSIQYHSKMLQDKCRRDGAEWWSYNTGQFTGANAPLNRFHTGLWMWKNRVQGNVGFAYMDPIGGPQVQRNGKWHILRYGEWTKHMFGAALPSPEGPIATMALTGFRDGTVDYRVLRELDRLIEQNYRHEKVPAIVDWLQSIRDKVPVSLEMIESRDVADTMAPPVDCAAVRRQALAYISELKGE